MEKRYQVFISSTFRDLQDERRQVVQALLELDCIPSGMEAFPASDETQWELIKRVIDACDYYVVIVGGRYGSVDSAGLSYTEKEYDYAVAQGLPVLGFVHAAPDEIPVGKSELEPALRAKLSAFRAKVQSRMCKMYLTSEELGGAVSRSLVQAIQRTPRDGWVRAKFALSPEQLNALRDENDALRAQLEELRIQPPVAAEGLAKGPEEFELRVAFSHFGDEHEGKLKFTWDRLVAILGPHMLDEASESRLRIALESAAKDLLGANGDEIYGVHINDEDFHTVMVQLLALGMINMSSKKHGVSDKSTYWSLTRYGEFYTTTLKAIRSKPGSA